MKGYEDEAIAYLTAKEDANQAASEAAGLPQAEAEWGATAIIYSDLQDALLAASCTSYADVQSKAQALVVAIELRVFDPDESDVKPLLASLREGRMNAVARQPDLRALMMFDTLPAGCIAHLVNDAHSMPHIRPGEFVVVDTTDRQVRHLEN